MRNPIVIGLILSALAIGGLLYYQHRHAATAPGAPAATETTPAASSTPAAETPAPGVRQEPVYPLAAASAPAAPLPPLDTSDAPVLDQLRQTFGPDAVTAFLVPKEVIRRIVATVDSLDRDVPAARLRPLAPVKDKLVTERDGDRLWLAETNSQRYQPMLAVLEAADPAQVAELYVRDYSLFQQAYAQLGYPNRYFNDRLVAVIDHLLAAPEPQPPLLLQQPGVEYLFADPALEQRSYGQKTMVRIGLAGEQALKDWLRRFRAAVLARTHKPKAP
jgi:hypothetical protein